MKKPFSFFGVALFCVTCARGQNRAAAAVPAVTLRLRAPESSLPVERLTYAISQARDAKGSGDQADRSSGKPNPSPRDPPAPPPPPRGRPPPPSCHKDKNDK